MPEHPAKEFGANRTSAFLLWWQKSKEFQILDIKVHFLLHPYMKQTLQGTDYNKSPADQEAQLKLLLENVTHRM